jgi:hypothetical protein
MWRCSQTPAAGYGLKPCSSGSVEGVSRTDELATFFTPAGWLAEEAPPPTPVGRASGAGSRAGAAAPSGAQKLSTPASRHWKLKTPLASSRTVARLNPNSGCSGPDLTQRYSARRLLGPESSSATGWRPTAVLRTMMMRQGRRVLGLQQSPARPRTGHRRTCWTKPLTPGNTTPSVGKQSATLRKSPFAQVSRRQHQGRGFTLGSKGRRSPPFAAETH